MTRKLVAAAVGVLLMSSFNTVFAANPASTTATLGNCSPYYVGTAATLQTVSGSHIFFNRTGSACSYATPTGSSISFCTYVQTFSELWNFNTSNNTFIISVPGSTNIENYQTGTYSGSLATNGYGGYNVNITLSCGGTLVGGSIAVGD